jgi:hypothetical protein
MSVGKDYVTRDERFSQPIDGDTLKKKKKISAFKKLLLSLGILGGSVVGINSTPVGNEILSNINNPNQSISQSYEIGQSKGKIQDRLTYFRKSSSNKHYRDFQSEYELFFSIAEHVKEKKDLASFEHQFKVVLDKMYFSQRLLSKPEQRLMDEKIKKFKELREFYLELYQKKGIITK